MYRYSIHPHNFKVGFKEGISEGTDVGLKEGFKKGLVEGASMGYSCGQLSGLLRTLVHISSRQGESEGMTEAKSASEDLDIRLRLLLTNEKEGKDQFSEELRKEIEKVNQIYCSFHLLPPTIHPILRKKH
eukprot:TRINITY_DN941_c0_g1_i1.p1 TRINITY_DN941_c0_g1~~TRINITY_DN941_c0_g1_i1.p1  ORF type:complete len:130 (+),score=23.82 TRINITY_DN941_c0_g1_i1:135-524(+)